VASTVRCLVALVAACAALTFGEAAKAQGVYVPMPGSLPAQTGSNLINPSAPASSVSPATLNPSAAPSAVMTPNALNPSATPSTFAPLSPLRVTSKFSGSPRCHPCHPCLLSGNTGLDRGRQFRFLRRQGIAALTAFLGGSLMTKAQIATATRPWFGFN
jgi:hypothetical protein